MKSHIVYDMYAHRHRERMSIYNGHFFLELWEDPEICKTLMGKLCIISSTCSDKEMSASQLSKNSERKVIGKPRIKKCECCNACASKGLGAKTDLDYRTRFGRLVRELTQDLSFNSNTCFCFTANQVKLKL